MKAEKALDQAIKNCKNEIKKVETDIQKCIDLGSVEMKLFKILEDGRILPGAIIQWLKMENYSICDNSDHYLVSWKWKPQRNH